MTEANLQNETDLRRFLLGAMPEAEREQFEARFITDEKLFEALRVAEDELIEAYVRETLSPAEKTSFEKHFLSTETRRQKIAFTRRMLGNFKNQTALIAVKKTETTAENSFAWNSLIEFFKTPKLAFAGVFGLSILVFGSWFLSKNLQTNEIAQTTTPTVQPTPITAPNQNLSTSNQIASNNSGGSNLNTAEKNLSNQNVAPNLNRNAPDKNVNLAKPSPPPRESAPMLGLFVGLSRSEGKTPELKLPTASAGANLQLNLESQDYKIYRVEITDADGNLIFQNKNLRAVKSKINFYVPAAKLRAGDYLVKLSALNSNNESESVADYSFRVNRK